MKKIIFLFAAVLCVMVAFGQNRMRFHHRITNDLDFVYIVDGDTLDLKVCPDDSFLRGIVTLDIKSGKLLIDFWSFGSKGQIEQKSTEQIKTGCITKDSPIGEVSVDLSRKKLGDPSWVVKVPLRAWTFSVGTIPFKYRFKADVSAATVNSILGVTAAFGRTWGKTIFTHRTSINRSYTVGPIVGFSTADIKKTTVKEPTTWDSTNDRINLAFSYGANIVFARNNLGLVVSVGFDNSFGPNSSDWSYQNKPWIGVGINTGLGIF